MKTTEKPKTFQEMVNSDTPTLVDFFATWCGPCVAMSPILKDLKGEMGEKANIIKVDVDRNPAAAQAFQVQGVPTFVLFKKGKMVWRQSGMLPKQMLKNVIEQHIDPA